MDGRPQMLHFTVNTGFVGPRRLGREKNPLFCTLRVMATPGGIADALEESVVML